MNKSSRTNNFEKRRKTTRMMSILMIVGVGLLIILIAIWIFGGKEKQAVDPNDDTLTLEENNENNNEPTDDNDGEMTEDNENTEETDKDNQENITDDPEESINGNQNTEGNEALATEPVEPSDDNVKIAYRGNWQPIGTVQSGPHTTTYVEGSADRNEIERAVKMVTGLDDMITWWLENGGDQKVIATVSDENQLDIYRVYLSWIDDAGWQPTKVEELITNDKKKN